MKSCLSERRVLMKWIDEKKTHNKKNSQIGHTANFAIPFFFIVVVVVVEQLMKFISIL